MSQHTPGPWVVVGNLIQTEGTDRERVSIAQTREGAFSDTPNARLIAAAPEVLELLERYVKRGDDLSAEYREARALLARLQPDTERKG